MRRPCVGYGEDIAWDNTAGTIYVSVSGEAGPNGNQIAVVDPNMGAITNYVAAGSEPDIVRVSDDDQYVYVGIDGAAGIQRFRLPAFTPDIFWNLVGSSSAPEFAFDLQIAPGTSNTVATVGSMGTGFPDSVQGVVISDNGVPRPDTARGNGFSKLQWGTDATTLYAAENDFYDLNINATGAMVIEDYASLLNGTGPSACHRIEGGSAGSQFF